jgi:hypothetical protein
MKNLAHRAWERWKKIAHAIGVFQTKLILNLLYYTLLLPFGVMLRLFGDPLSVRPSRRETGWLERTTRDKSLDDLRKQS